MAHPTLTVLLLSTDAKGNGAKQNIFRPVSRFRFIRRLSLYAAEKAYAANDQGQQDCGLGLRATRLCVVSAASGSFMRLVARSQSPSPVTT